MKYYFTILLIFSYTILLSQNYWEKLEIPSNLPALNLTIASDGSVFSSGIGVYHMDSDGKWESKNRLKTNFNGIDFDGGLNEIGLPIYGLLELNSETLIAILGEDLVMKSTDYGENWGIISNEVRRPQMILEHNGNVIIASRRGVYKLNSELDSAINIYDSDSFITEIIHNGNKLIAKYEDYIDNDYFESIKVFDLETEMLVDSITLSDFNVNGDYYENGTTAYILSRDTLFVSDVLIRTGAEPKITSYILGQYFNQEMLEKHNVDLDAINFFDNGKMVISNSNSDEFLIADAQFSNPEVYRLHGYNFRIRNSAKKIYPYEDSYLISTDFGIFEAKNKNFNNLENISTTMGNGVYESVVETNDGYIASYNNFIYGLSGNDNIEILSAAERDLHRWNDSYWYSLDDSLFFTKDYGATWTKHIIEGQYYGSEYRSHDNNTFTVTASDEIYLVNYSDLSLQTIAYPEFEDTFSYVNFITMKGDNIIAITSEGTFEYDDSDNWTKIVDYSYIEELDPFMGYYGNYFEFVNGTILVFNEWGILKMENYGESIEPYELSLPRNPKQRFIRLGDKFYLYANEDESPFYDFYELYIDDQNNLVSNMLSEDQSTAIFQSFTPTQDGKLIVSNLSGTFKTKEQIVTNVEDTRNIAKELFIYPNISDSYINVVTNDFKENNWKIYDLNGNRNDVDIITIDNATTTIDISTFPRGKYIISNETQSGFFIKK